MERHHCTLQQNIPQRRSDGSLQRIGSPAALFWHKLEDTGPLRVRDFPIKLLSLWRISSEGGKVNSYRTKACCWRQPLLLYVLSRSVDSGLNQLARWERGFVVTVNKYRFKILVTNRIYLPAWLWETDQKQSRSDSTMSSRYPWLETREQTDEMSDHSHEIITAIEREMINLSKIEMMIIFVSKKIYSLLRNRLNLGSISRRYSPCFLRKSCSCNLPLPLHKCRSQLGPYTTV